VIQNAHVANIDGIKIQFYWDDHPPSHFHAEFGEYRAQIGYFRLVRLTALGHDVPWVKA